MPTRKSQRYSNHDLSTNLSTILAPRQSMMATNKPRTSSANAKPSYLVIGIVVALIVGMWYCLKADPKNAKIIEKNVSKNAKIIEASVAKGSKMVWKEMVRVGGALGEKKKAGGWNW